MTRMRKRLATAAGLALLSAVPAAAQTGLCGGVGDTGQWIGGAEASSDVTVASAHLEQMALVLARNEYVALFSLSAPTEVRLEAQGRGGGDPVIDLRDSNGNLIVSDDDSGGGGASRAETMLEAGTYCLSMKSYDGAPMTGFVRVGRIEHEALTEGLGEIPAFDPDPGMNTGGGCTAVSNFIGDGPIDGSLFAGGASATASVNEVDAWGFSLNSATALSITAVNPDADPYITLYDGMGNYLAENDDYDGLNSRLDMTFPLTAGDYCIEMRALSDNSLPITVTVTGYDPAEAQSILYARGEASPPLDGSHPVVQLGTLGTRLRQDAQMTSQATWYAFDIDQAGLVLIEAISNGIGDPIAYLYDDFGRQIAMNDDNGQTLDSLITARVLPGTYLLGVRHLSDGQQGLIRVLFERYVPAQ